MDLKLYNFVDRAGYYLQEGQYSKAIALYKGALDLADKENRIDLLYNLATIYDYVDKNRESLDAYKELISLNPTDPVAVYSVAMIYEKMGNYSQAENYYLKCIELDPSYDRAYFFLVNLYEL